MMVGMGVPQTGSPAGHRNTYSASLYEFRAISSIPNFNSFAIFLAKIIAENVKKTGNRWTVPG